MESMIKIASQVRRDILRMTTAAGCGHPGGSMSSADILTWLFFKEMKHDPASWTRSGKDQDVFILSAGHLAPVLYSVLARSGYFPVQELGTLRKLGTRLQGHPSIVEGLPGIHKPSGSLGQGLAVAAGIAKGKLMDSDSHRVFVLCGDGELEEGEIWESAMWAAHHKISNLVAMVDWNNQQIDGTADTVGGIKNLPQMWAAFGWEVIEADGHDFASIEEAFRKAAVPSQGPKVILFKTDMGHGVDFMAGTCEWHGKATNAEQCAAALAQLEETLGDY